MKETFYFTHDYNARDDAKILNMMADLGWEGYGLFWAIIEKLAEANGKLLLSNLKGIAFSCQVEQWKVNNIITLYNLFETDENYFWSNRLLQHLTKRQKIAKIRAKLGKKGGLATAKQLLKQNQAKERKGKERKEDTLSYEEPPKETFNTKAKTFEKLGIPYSPKKKTSKQEQYLERCKLVDYFKEAVNQEHGKSYFTHPDDIKDIQKENSKISAMMKTFVDRCGTIEKSKEVIDWFATGQNKFFEETGYKPQICFRKETVVEFENNIKKEIKPFIINKHE